MHNPELEALIPDIRLKEHRPAGYPELSAYRLAWLRTCWGYKGWGRRVWVNPDPTAESLALGVTVEGLHCFEDAVAIIEGGRPAVATLAGLSRFGPVVSEQGTPATRILRWHIGDLKCENRTVPLGSGVVCSALAVGRDATSVALTLDSVLQETGQRVGGETAPRRCRNVFRRYLWSLITAAIFMVPAILIPGSVAFALTPDPVPLLVFIAATIFAGYALTRWGQHNRLRQQRQVWGLILTQGDTDGTIRRALATIGIELPEAAPPLP